MRIAVVYNSHSGSALSTTALGKEFEAAGIQVAQFIDITKYAPSELKKIISKYEKVAAYGGDGTICSVADAVANTKIILAPLPGGTLNHFTKDLGVHQDLKEAIARLKKVKVRHIDVASVSGKTFVNNSSIGIYPSSLRERSRYEKHLGKWPAAFVAGIRAFFRFRIYDVTLNDTTFRTPFIFIGNNVYDSTKGMSRDSIDQGVLSVFVIRSAKRRTLLKLLALSIFNRVDEAKELQSFTATTVTVASRRSKLRVATDGEHQLMKTPLEYVVQPSVLNVL